MRSTKTKANDSFTLISVLFCLLYFTSYMTRKSFSAVKLGIPDSVLTDVQIGYIGSALFFTYGAGQIVSGLLGDRIDPRKLIFCGLGVTTLCNAAFPFVTSVPLLIVLWAINGFAQALFWPPIVKLMTIYLKGERYTKAVMSVSMAAQIALLAVYASAALFVSLTAWKGMFALSCALAIITGIGLVFGFRTLERRHPNAVRDALTGKTVEPIDAPDASDAQPAPKKEGLWRIILSSGLLFVFVMTATVGFLRDGIEEWMSTYLYTTFTLEADLSTLMNLFMPVFGLFCVRMAAVLHLRIIKDEMREVTVLMSICAAATLALGLFHTLHPVFSIVMIVLSVGCIHAANTSLTCYLPARFVKSGRVSTVSGLVNAFTYVGSTIATSAVPWLVQTTSWQATILSWCAVGLACLAACVLIGRTWKRFLKQNED
ncbi:MAG: MFS transporter [Clostridia bacterium]|nr:MFS transporter [Clostridia bacterium]